MLSISKGQILRVAATLRVLFHIDTPLAIPSVIGKNAVKAAIDLVDVCIQQAAFLAGRGNVQEAIEELANGNPIFWCFHAIMIAVCDLRELVWRTCVL